MAPITFACDCGQKLSAPDVNAGRKGRCPKCGAVTTIPVPSSDCGRRVDFTGIPPAAVPRRLAAFRQQVSAPGQAGVTGRVLPRTMKANRRFAGKACPICQAQLRLGEGIRVCGHCELPFHQTCWDENNGCGTYGCPCSPPAEPRVSAPPPLPSGQTPPAPRVARRCCWAWWVAAGLVLVFLGGALCISVTEHIELQRPMNDVISLDPRNSSINVQCRYGGWFEWGVLAYDLREVS